MKDFTQSYEEFYIERFIYSIAEVETYEDKKKIMQSVLEAYQYLLEVDGPLTLGNIKTVGNKVNSTDENIPEGFRRIVVTPGDKANFTPVRPNLVPSSLSDLLYNYYYIWEGLDPFLKEAMFHIKYMRIHPFEDGNKRSGKLILTTNLCKAGLPPILITKEDTSAYYEFVSEEDYEGFAEFIRQRSHIENTTMCAFYKAYYDLSILDDVDGEEVQKSLVFKKDTRN